MARTIREMMVANLFEVFNEVDAQRRVAAIANLFVEDALFSDHHGVVTGYEAINAAAQALHERFPGFVFTAAGPAYEVHDLGYLTWHFGPPEQPPIVNGLDIALVRDSRIVALYTILTTQANA